tara:strand:+ start:2383 stop:3213 length:831 start_codon:yes stop_codon:yes gene_type:complete
MSNLNDIFNPHIIDQWNQCGNTSPDSSFSLWEENKTRFTTNQLCKMRPLLNSSNVPYLSHFENASYNGTTHDISAAKAFNDLEWETNYIDLQAEDTGLFYHVYHNQYWVPGGAAEGAESSAVIYPSVTIEDTSFNCSFIHDNYHVKDMCANTFCLLDFMAVKLDACNNQLCDDIKGLVEGDSESVIPTDITEICSKKWAGNTALAAAATGLSDVESDTYQKSYTSTEFDELLTKYENETREEELKNDFKKLYNSNLFEICYLVTGIIVILYIVKKS